MSAFHLHKDAYKDPRRHALHLADITIGRADPSRFPPSRTLGIFWVWEIGFRKLESSDVNCWTSEVFASPYSEVVSTVDFLDVCRSFAAPIILMILNFWIIPLYIVLQVGDAVGVGWDFVSSATDDFLDFFVGYAFTSPL